MKTDKVQKLSGKVVKFGTKQLNNPTPDWARMTFRIILYLSTLYALAIQPNLDIPADIQAMINKWLLALNGFVNVTIEFFGWDNN